MDEELMTAPVVRDLALQTAKIETFRDDAAGIHVAKINRGDGSFSLEDLVKFEHRDAPQRIEEKPSFQDANSFIEYLEAFKGDSSRIFFDNDNSTFTAVVDFAGKDSPAWGKHVTTFPLRYSEEWKIWSAAHGKLMGQSGFGRFLEDNSIDVIQPDGATLIEMAMNFEATKTIAFREATRLKNGTVQLQWLDETKPVGSEIPDHITIRIPVFYNSSPREIQLRFKYQLNTQEQKLQIGFEIVRMERVKLEAAAEIVQDVRAATGLPIHFGKRA